MIVCCGFVNSGTRLIHRIVETDLGLEAEHRSYPHWEKLWDWHDFPKDTKFIVITRRPDVAIRSAKVAGHPGIKPDVKRDPPADVQELTHWWYKGMKMMASIPDAYWISYEALVADPVVQTANLAHHLGVTKWYMKRQIRDENQKWL